MKAYHFTNASLRDGSPIPPIGKKLVFKGEIELCKAGYHASLHPFDALSYAPGNTLHLVKMSGKLLHQDDKLVASERTIIKTIDAEQLLFQCARKWALDVAHLWDCPPIVKEYLLTGAKSLRDAARAAWAAAWDVARASAGASAWAATVAAAQDVARASAWDVARASARASAWAATGASAQGAARASARASAWAAAWDAAEAAAWAAQRSYFLQQVNLAFKGE